MYTLPLLFALPVLLAAQDIQPLTILLPPCIIPCLETIFLDACGSTTDWACACMSNQISFMNAGCVVAVDTCTSAEIIDAQGLIAQICAIEIQAHGSSSATLGSNDGSASATSTPTRIAPSQILTSTPITTSQISVPAATAPSATPTSTTPSQINVPAATAPSATPTASNNPSKSMASRTLGASMLRSVLKAAYMAISAAWLLAG